MSHQKFTKNPRFSEVDQEDINFGIRFPSPPDGSSCPRDGVGTPGDQVTPDSLCVCRAEARRTDLCEVNDMTLSPPPPGGGGVLVPLWGGGGL